MINHVAYAAARAVAPRVWAYFSEHAGSARRTAEPHAPPPDVGTIEALVDAVFWASLRREEGYVPRISLAFISPDQTGEPLLFARPLPLTPAALARVAPAVERRGIHLGTSWADGELRVWGASRHILPYTFVLEVAAPGLLVIKHHRGGELRKYVNVAVLEGDHVRVVDERASGLPDCPGLLTSLLGFDVPAASRESSVNVLVQVAVSMRGHGRGGLLLVVPAGDEEWRASIVQPVMYALEPQFSGLSSLMAAHAGAPDDDPVWQDALARVVDTIAGLTAVDGATLITDRYDLIAFGGKVVRRRGSSPVQHVGATEPIEGGVATVADPAVLGGTRHLAAAQFVHDQRRAMALVASQDGRFTALAWSPSEDMVHAHRIETLLL